MQVNGRITSAMDMDACNTAMPMCMRVHGSRIIAPVWPSTFMQMGTFLWADMSVTGEKGWELFLW